jgi:hypothetical protein
MIGKLLLGARGDYACVVDAARERRSHGML